MESRNVILRPIVTEKGMYYAENFSVYPFEVSRQANKADIRNAVESIYDVKVEGVRTMNMQGKMRRVRYNRGRKRGWKKALVTLTKGQTIEII